MDADSKVKHSLAGVDDLELVGGDTRRLKRFRTNNFFLLRSEIDAAFFTPPLNRDLGRSFVSEKTSESLSHLRK